MTFRESCLVSFCIGLIFSPVFAVGIISKAPVSTTFVVMLLTIFSFGKGWTAALAYIGILLFGASFLIGENYGLIPALIVWAIGIVAWFAGIYCCIAGVDLPRFRTPTIILA
jgi:hypothetical protein